VISSGPPAFPLTFLSDPRHISWSRPDTRKEMECKKKVVVRKKLVETVAVGSDLTHFILMDKIIELIIF
jgi:hypothetical protein